MTRDEMNLQEQDDAKQEAKRRWPSDGEAMLFIVAPAGQECEVYGTRPDGVKEAGIGGTWRKAFESVRPQ